MRRRLILTLGLAIVVGALSVGIAIAAAGGVADSRAAPGPAGPAADAPQGCGRVDLVAPTFSNPASITNPLFPKSSLDQVIQLGVEGEDTLRFEVTQLEETHVVAWNGQQIETRVTHFVAYSNGRILEVAVDFYAQADDGAVWYFGENVDNYEDGEIVNHEGTWLAGRDGPPGMIMPANPQVCDVYRPENIPGLVFEEVTVQAVGLTVDGPRGPVAGSIAVQEQLLDGTLEDKVYAPGYGEFRAEVASSDELYFAALAVPIDALPGRMPRDLSALTRGAERVFDTASSSRWSRITRMVDTMNEAWDAYRSRGVPELLDVQMTDALAALEDAVEGQEPAEVRQAAIDVGQAGLDLQLQFRSASDVDEDRLDLWKRQLRLDRAVGDSAGVTGDLATIGAIRDRIADDTRRGLRPA
jgi:hypothetical protein